MTTSWNVIPCANSPSEMGCETAVAPSIATTSFAGDAALSGAHATPPDVEREGTSDRAPDAAGREAAGVLPTAPSQHAGSSAAAPPPGFGSHDASGVAIACGEDAGAHGTEGGWTPDGADPPSRAPSRGRAAAGDGADAAVSGSADGVAGVPWLGNATTFDALGAGEALEALWYAAGFAACPITVAACGADAASPGPNRCMHP